jgi:hypothetical protein
MSSVQVQSSRTNLTCATWLAYHCRSTSVTVTNAKHPALAIWPISFSRCTQRSRDRRDRLPCLSTGRGIHSALLHCDNTRAVKVVTTPCPDQRDTDAGVTFCDTVDGKVLQAGFGDNWLRVHQHLLDHPYHYLTVHVTYYRNAHTILVRSVEFRALANCGSIEDWLRTKVPARRWLLNQEALSSGFHSHGWHSSTAAVGAAGGQYYDAATGQIKSLY